MVRAGVRTEAWYSSESNSPLLPASNRTQNNALPPRRASVKVQLNGDAQLDESVLVVLVHVEGGAAVQLALQQAVRAFGLVPGMRVQYRRLHLGKARPRLTNMVELLVRDQECDGCLLSSIMRPISLEEGFKPLDPSAFPVVPLVVPISCKLPC